MSTYKKLLNQDREVSAVKVNVSGVDYMLIEDGQYVWATPKSEFDRVIKQEAEVKSNGDWYTNFCQSLPYDAEFCRKHEIEFAAGMTVENGHMPDARRTFNWA